MSITIIKMYKKKRTPSASRPPFQNTDDNGKNLCYTDSRFIMPDYAGEGDIPMLELKHISYSVESEGKVLPILQDINLKLDDGFIAFTGPNGGGKSTLAKVIAGIIKPTEGQILLDGVDITEMTITERARAGISFAFQQPVRFKGITVKTLLDLASGKKLSVKNACAYLSEVGLCAADYINREVNDSLSGGELKRIEIATVIARGTKLSLFDEPEAGIDLWSFQNLIQVFERMHNEINGSILIISHQERILNIADQIVVLAGGKVQQMGPKDEVLPTLLQGRSCISSSGGCCGRKQ